MFSVLRGCLGILKHNKGTIDHFFYMPDLSEIALRIVYLDIMSLDNKFSGNVCTRSAEIHPLAVP